MDTLRTELRKEACQEAMTLVEALATLSPSEQVEYLIPLLFGVGINLGGRVVAAAVRRVAVEKAADLIMEGYHVEALRLAATLGDKELATKALVFGLLAHREPDDKYNQRLLVIYAEEVGMLPDNLDELVASA